MVEDLASELTDEQLLKGLQRLRKEREWISVKAIIELAAPAEDDGRPGVESAWAMCPVNDLASVVWTTEMAESFGLCRDMLVTGDTIAARMVFKEQYQALVSKARAAHRSVRWMVSLGWDVNGRIQVLADGVQQKRIEAKFAMSLLAPGQQDELIKALPASTRMLLIGGSPNDKLKHLSGLQKTIHALVESKAISAPDPIDSLKTVTEDSVLNDPKRLRERRQELKEKLNRHILFERTQPPKRRKKRKGTI
jgi:hypothetical protein